MTELPTSFGKYFLTEKLATGGMAEIYLAKIVGPGGFEKPVVIKQIHPRLSGQRHFVDLFVAEAKTLVTMTHGNIVPVYELGVIDDTYFIAMEYIDGPTLYRLTEALARRGVVMEPAIAAWITARIVEGLDYAHRKGEGIIHRDLSPRNVMLSRDGEVKLVDFGIAVSLGTTDGGPDEQAAPTGSFPYMSPEQVRREALSGQTDLFSVGVLCWEMLVGRRLFARPDADATLAAVTGAEIERPSVVRPEIPARLDEVVMRALDRDLTGRWTSAGEMLGALQKYLYNLDATPGPRDLAALVAKYCPPETRRLPTHVESPAPDGDVVPGGPRTAVIPRDGAPRGKQRARTETFATNVELQHMFERATPLFPIPAIDDGDGGDGAPAEPPATSVRSRMARDTVETNPPAPRTGPTTRVTARADDAAAGPSDPRDRPPRRRRRQPDDPRDRPPRRRRRRPTTRVTARPDDAAAGPTTRVTARPDDDAASPTARGRPAPTTPPPARRRT
ncbi:MAG: serine/threonine protein kinase [Deltaproteobacteria bacterium]|nr:serine/threonine protein kinase [Deltaproteobacteria bacterium]